MTEGMPPAAPMAPAPPPMAPAADARPTGATVVSIIDAIIGVLAVLGGLVLILGAGLLGGLIGSADVENAVGIGGFIAGLGIVFGIIVLLIGILYLAIAYGVWKGRGWSWMLGMIVAVISIVFGVLGLSGGVSTSTIISLVLPIVVVYFLWQPDVKRWLGRPA